MTDASRAPTPNDPADLYALFGAVRDETATPAQLQRLEARMLADPSVAAEFVRFMQLHAILEYNYEIVPPPASCRASPAHSSLPAMVFDNAPTGAFPEGTVPSGFGRFFTGWPLAYLVASVLLGVGMWIGAAWIVSHPASTAGRSLPTGRHDASERVGRITGMADCRQGPPSHAERQDSASARAEPIVPRLRAPVFLSDTVCLASGLIEVTYDSGAKIVLEGPVTYEINSTDGGRLEVGKLRARVEAGVARGQTPKAKSAGQPRFTINTPTTTVTDLGTEFGVEVSNVGACEVHVLQGRVKAVCTSGVNVGAELTLSENEAVRLDPTESSRPILVADAGRFKNMPPPQKGPAGIRFPILDKTLVAWVRLANTQQRGVGVVSMVNNRQFDAIVFGELAPRKWMAGSHVFERSQWDQSAYPTETAGPGELVQIAVVYDRSWITIYRNGQEYIRYDAGNCHAFYKDMTVLIGKRHLDWDTRLVPETLAGRIDEVRIYDEALKPEIIASLELDEPSSLEPIGWWTFDDETPRDVMGRFPMGELRGNARIADGSLILDGQQSYLFVPPPVTKHLP